MKRIAKKIKRLAGGKGKGILRNAARRLRPGKAEIKSVFLSEDGSWSWFSRILILCAAFVIAALIVRYFSDDITRLLWSWNLGKPVSKAKYEEIIGEGHIFSFVVTLTLFGLFFGLGNWAIKNHDVKKVSRDKFRDRKEQSFSDASHSLLESSSAGGNVRNAHGLRTLARLAHQGTIAKERIHAVTRGGHNLQEAKLQGAMLMDMDLQFVQLSGALLVYADLSRANLFYAKLTDVDLSKAKLISACLVEADLINAKFIEADLSEADLSRANLRSAALIKARLSDARLAGADLQETKLAEANLRRADLSRADLSGADLSNTDLCGTDLQSANLAGTGLEGAVYNENTKFPEGFAPEKHGLQLLKQ